MRFGCLIGSILLALWATHGRLRLYFMAQLAYTLGCQYVKWRFGSEGDLYTFTWAMGTALILGVSFLLVERTYVLTGMGLGAALSVLSLYGIPKPWVTSDWVNLAAGGLLVALAYALGKEAKDSTSLILSILWFCLAAWSFGWPMHFNLPVWRRLNWVIPTWLCVAAFSWIGLTGWRKKLA